MRTVLCCLAVGRFFTPGVPGARERVQVRAPAPEIFPGDMQAFAAPNAYVAPNFPAEGPKQSSDTTFKGGAFLLGAAAAAGFARALPQRAKDSVRFAVAAALALVLSGTPMMSHAAPTYIEQSSTTYIAAAADADTDLDEAKRKFLEERAKIKQQYDSDYESNYVTADQITGKKSIYTVVVGGLIVVAFVAPMLQFFYYTGGE